MASKMAKAVITGTHTAGIYSDMSVDGPEIGTLVVVVDRAKNLPNRKTMGKQDPYCAARLGKEAKKTETDKRGGQTPRWDQELRFTVHDSLDYHQLKVSVFNDDKKTDLIGETWISLEEVVIPGGGKNDLWHNLNCKGRYAGEVRIELTFYDTRPKEEKLVEVQPSSPVIANQDRVQDIVSGPRQPKPVKRRPLPADPTTTDSSSLRPTMPEHSQSSPLPYTPPRSLPRVNNPPISSLQGSVDHDIPLYRQSPQYGYDAQASSTIYNPHNPEAYDRTISQDYSREAPYTSQPEQYPLSGVDNYTIEADYSNHHERHHDADYLENRSQHQVEYQDSSSYPTPVTQNNQQNEYQPLDLPELPSYEPRHTRPTAQPVTSQSVYGTSHSSPAAMLPQRRPMLDTRHQRQFNVEDPRSSRQSSNAYDLSPLRHQSIESGYNSEPLSSEPFAAEEGPPPVPPAHRSNGLRSIGQYEGQESRQAYSQVAAPAPLNIRHSKGNSLANTYSHYGNDPGLVDRTLSASPSNTQLSIHSAPSNSSHTSYTQSGRRQSQGPANSHSDDRYVHSTPPSLVPGYDPSIAEEESERIIHEKRMSVRPPQSYTSLPSHDRSPICNPQSRQRPLPQYQAVTKSHSQDEYSPSNRTHTTSLAIVKPQAISPDPRTPIRKSVSPQPSFDDQKKVSPIPFSPDSYETFNPNLKSASSFNKAPSQYNTPEQSKDSPNLHPQDETSLDEGPIIGSDGRVIDPSDHLPTETWAPEPERKPPRKGPEITFRFRNSPQGAQPMPNAAPRPPRETVIRPQSISTTVHSYSTSDVSPTAATRNRLQKKPQARASYVQPASSPMLPTLPPANSNSNSNPTTPYPLREHVNFGYGSSPTYARGSPGAPPPVPAKVLVGRGQEEWGTDALSEEMRRIDIGVGGGSGGRARRRFEG